MWTWLCSVCLCDNSQLNSKPAHFSVFFFFFNSQENRSIQHVVRLQVAEAKPLVIQSDVMQRELESCWRLRQAGEDHGAPLAQQAALCTFGKENSMKLLPENRHENVSACSFLV